MTRTFICNHAFFLKEGPPLQRQLDIGIRSGKRSLVEEQGLLPFPLVELIWGLWPGLLNSEIVSALQNVSISEVGLGLS